MYELQLMCIICFQIFQFCFCRNFWNKKNLIYQRWTILYHHTESDLLCFCHFGKLLDTFWVSFPYSSFTVLLYYYYSSPSVTCPVDISAAISLCKSGFQIWVLHSIFGVMTMNHHCEKARWFLSIRFLQCITFCWPHPVYRGHNFYQMFIPRLGFINLLMLFQTSKLW